ncbi:MULTISPECIES: hypothetical protein [unclassified Yoonia]|uniref:hypothetical protein n=1 Tax=unclassified Yoonia TaxID=2629118 RepID=UPI0037277783
MSNPFTRGFVATAFALSLLAPVATQADQTDAGRWSEQINYIAEHGVSVINTGNGPALIVLETALGPDVDADLRLHLGKDGVANPAANLGRLAKIRGLQVFEAPASIDISDFNELHIWNADVGAPIGFAPLR